MKRMTYTVALVLTSLAVVACDKPADQGHYYDAKYDGAGLSSMNNKVDPAVVAPRARLSNEAVDALKPTATTPATVTEPAKDSSSTDTTNTPTPAAPADAAPSN